MIYQFHHHCCHTYYRKHVQCYLQTFLNNSNLSSTPLWEKVTSVKKAANGADAIIFLTEWDEYQYLNWQEIEEVMRPPSWLFDWRATINKKKVLETNLQFWRIGEGHSKKN